MRVLVNRNGRAMPFDAGGRVVGRRSGSTANLKIRLTVSGVTLRSLPLASACCPGGFANPWKVQSVASGVNGTFDLTTTDGCSWSLSNNTVEVRRCNPDSLVDANARVVYGANYCGATGRWRGSVVAFTFLAHDTRPQIFSAVSAADACLPLTFGNAYAGTETTCFAGYDCTGTLRGDSLFAGQVIAGGGSIDVEWLCP
jgi:hypothetical protein